MHWPIINPNMNILITGSNGFIAKNLVSRLKELGNYIIHEFNRDSLISELEEMINCSDMIIHLAGVNRPENEKSFEIINVGLTNTILDLVKKSGKKIPIFFSSSTQVGQENSYAVSKLKAENILQIFSKEYKNPVAIARLPNVFGKWARPNYNSVVATYCHNVANGLGIKINDPKSELTIMHVDDLVNIILKLLNNFPSRIKIIKLSACHKIMLGELAATIKSFSTSRATLLMDRVGSGLIRSLYSTYVSYIPVSKFSYSLKSKSDSRGTFVEFLKFSDSGQVSLLVVKPGQSRGGHYHHTKTEKFFVVSGFAEFIFNNKFTGENSSLIISDESMSVVDTVPGWAHSVKNIGKTDLLIFLWASELIDLANPDTFSFKGV